MRSRTLTLSVFGIALCISCWHMYRMTVTLIGNSNSNHRNINRNSHSHSNVRLFDLGETIRQVPAKTAAQSIKEQQKQKQKQPQHHTIVRSDGTTKRAVRSNVVKNLLRFNKNKENNNKAKPILRKCNCTDHTCIDTRLCHRGIISIHKMGVTLVNTLQHKYFGIRVPTAELVDHIKLGQKFRKRFAKPFAKDYRQVVVTRNWLDSLLSGYLYHRNHMECELDWFGQIRKNYTGWLFNNTQEDWEARLYKATTLRRQQQQQQQHNQTNDLEPWPAGNGRDLCTYLSDESEYDGLRVYVEWAKHAYLDPLMQFVQQRRDDNHTLFVCYEDLITNYTGVMKQMVQFIHRPPKVPINPNDGQTDRDKRDLEAGRLHAVKADPAKKERLKAIIQDLDVRLFDGAIAAGDAALGCHHQAKSATSTKQQ